MELSNREVVFLKNVLSSEDSKHIFINIFEKFIDELKDIETLKIENVKDFNKQIEIRLEAIKKIREIISKVIILTENLDNNIYKPI